MGSSSESGISIWFGILKFFQLDDHGKNHILTLSFNPPSCQIGHSAQCLVASGAKCKVGFTGPSKDESRLERQFRGSSVALARASFPFPGTTCHLWALPAGSALVSPRTPGPKHPVNWAPGWVSLGAAPGSPTPAIKPRRNSAHWEASKWDLKSVVRNKNLILPIKTPVISWHSKETFFIRVIRLCLMITENTIAFLFSTHCSFLWFFLVGSGGTGAGVWT